MELLVGAMFYINLAMGSCLAVIAGLYGFLQVIEHKRPNTLRALPHLMEVSYEEDNSRNRNMD